MLNEVTRKDDGIAPSPPARPTPSPGDEALSQTSMRVRKRAGSSEPALRLMLPTLLLSLCVVLRVAPHPPNFAPVGASAVFAGRTMKPWAALGLTAAAMFVGDVILARLYGYPVVSPVTPFIYGGFFGQALLGRALRSKKGGAIAAASLGSVVFFALSNVGVWLHSAMYAHTASGLLACYVAAIPFFPGTVLGDVVWTLLLSAGYRQIASLLAARRGAAPALTQELSSF